AKVGKATRPSTICQHAPLMRPAARMSAFGPKQTSLVALHMSAFGGKADIALTPQCGKKTRGCADTHAQPPRGLKALPPITKMYRRQTPTRLHCSLAWQFFICREEHITSSEIVLMRQKTKFE